jgi:LacI family transcriptional regulator
MKVTIADLAKEAGVSIATVDRVVNQRQGVRPETRDQVLGVAERLGYLVPTLAPITLDFLLPGSTNTYLKLLAQSLEQQDDLPFKSRVRVHRIASFFDPDAVCKQLLSLRGDSDGIGMIVMDHPKVREAIRNLNAAKIPLLTLVSDIPDVTRIGYIGIDSRAAGRLAGHLLGRFMKSRRRKVALFAGSLSYRDHSEREFGFRQIFAEDFPLFVIVQLQENFDDWKRSCSATKELLNAHPDLGGIYNIGGGNRGIVQALEETGLAGQVVFIGHELTEHTRRFLLSGVMDAVIDQNPRREAREAVIALSRAARGLPVQQSDLTVGIQVIFRENIPLY